MGEIIQDAEFCNKVTASVFWDGEGTLLKELLDKNATNKSQRHVYQALKKLKQRT